jgi:membrane-associated protease RseP (regulator of RpoE activity)
MVGLLLAMRSQYSNGLVCGLALVELSVGLALTLGFLTVVFGLVAVVLLALFSVTTAAVILVWGEVECGCFGGLEKGLSGWIGVLRNLALLAFALTAVEFGQPIYSVDGLIWLNRAKIQAWPPITMLVLALAGAVLCIGGYRFGARHLASLTMPKVEKHKRAGVSWVGSAGNNRE